MTTSDICDELGFSFVLHRSGSSDLFVVCGHKTHTCWVSGVFSDAAFELLKLCRGILTNAPTSIALYGEPGGNIISVTADAEQQHTMLFAMRELDPSLPSHEISDEGTVIFSVRVKRKQLLGLFMAELWKVHYFLREPSFQKNRDKFPGDTLRTLNAEWDSHRSLGPSFLK
jgi:hypothetical protein